MADTKGERIYIRVSEKIRDDFDAVAEHRGLTRSGLLHSLIVKTIHDARKEVPEIFAKTTEREVLKKNETETEEFDESNDIPSITFDELKKELSEKKKK